MEIDTPNSHRFSLVSQRKMNSPSSTPQLLFSPSSGRHKQRPSRSSRVHLFGVSAQYKVSAKKIAWNMHG
jgi:hypothetical protein